MKICVCVCVCMPGSAQDMDIHFTTNQNKSEMGSIYTRLLSFTQPF